MNKLEFNEVMKAVGLNKSSTVAIGRYGTDEDVYYLNDLAIYHSGSNYAEVDGKIPLEIADIIYNKYPNYIYKIRIDGCNGEQNPIDWVTDDQYEKDMKEYIGELCKRKLSEEDLKTMYENIKTNFEKRSDEDKYVQSYHIYTKEGLLAFLTEMKDYYLRKNNLPESEVKKYDELLAKVCSELLEKINPAISGYEWMQEDEKNKDSYNSIIERDNKTELGRIMREAILEFDKAVNPFLNDDLEFDDIKNYLKKVRINAILNKSMNDNDREGCYTLEIYNPDTDEKTSYSRFADGFSFQLSYNIDDKHHIYVSHYFSPDSYDKSNIGETISISTFGDNMKDKNHIILNITNGTIEEKYDDRKQVSPEQIVQVYNLLQKATSYASSITIENMKKKTDNKQLLYK